VVPVLPRRAPRPLLDALHSPHEHRPHGPHGEGSDSDGSGSSSSSQLKTVAKASSLPLDLGASTTTNSSRVRAGGRRAAQSWAEAVAPYVEILRPQNILPAMLLVLMGAWVREVTA
jgi:hypothetical protein